MDLNRFLKNAGHALQLEVDRISREAEGDNGLSKLNASQLKDYLLSAEIYERIRARLAEQHQVDKLPDSELRRLVKEHLKEDGNAE